MNPKRFTIIGSLIMIIVIAASGYFVFARMPTQETSKEPASSLQPTTAYNYYVSPIGNDANDGSAARPWRRINYAAQRVRPGDTVHVLPGFYNEALNLSTQSAINTEIDGTPTAPIKFICTQKWMCLVTTTAPDFRIHYSVWDNGGNYVTIQDFDISGTNVNGGITDGATFSRIIGNRVHDLPIPCTDSGGAGLNMAGQGTEFIGNVVGNIGVIPQPPSNPWCPWVHNIYVQGQGGKFQNNIVFGSAGFGIAGGGSNHTISNNLVFKNAAGGISGNGNDAIDTWRNNLVTNNITINNRFAGIYEVDMLNDFPSNIGQGNRYFNNLVWRNISPQDGVEYGIVVCTACGSVEQGTVTADPAFVRYRGDGAGDYRLQAGSPAIDVGTSEGAPNLDFNGISRPQGERFDIGPYEWR